VVTVVDGGARPITLAEAVAEFEHGFTVHPCEPCAAAPTGELHEVVTSIPGACFTEDEAARSWLMKVRKYADGRGLHLYWRVRPEISREGAPRNRIKVYSRLCVSHVAAGAFIPNPP
jgi:hypothetical protein